MDTTFICAICNELHPTSERTEVGGTALCDNCLSDYTIFCDHCGERILHSDNAGSRQTILCQNCYDAHYYRCAECGRVIYEDDRYFLSGCDDTVYCEDCYENSTGSIRSYDYKPYPIFYGDGPRFMGVELEIDNGGEYNSNANEILRIANEHNVYAYCKHDGSLDEGFEIVTHPMSLQFHEQEMPWNEIMQKAVRMGYTSHQAKTCGLHVHISRRAFGDTYEAQEEAIARVLYFFEKHWEELLKFSRRTKYQLDRWATRYGYKEQPHEILKQAKENYGRYTCVNLNNDSTIEFRMFRGTLRTNTLIATLQLLNRICDVAISLSDCELKGLSWSDFVSGCRQPELIQYLKERRLYVNEPVEVTEEV